MSYRASPNKFLLSMAAVVGIGVPAPANATEEIKVTIVAGHPTVTLWVKHEQQTLIPTVNAELAKTGNYKINWTEAYGGTLAKVGEELEAVQDGVADIALAWSVFDAAKLPLQNVSLFTPFVDGDTNCATDVTEDLQRDIPEMGAQWGKYNQVYLGGGIYADPFHMWSRAPVKSLDDLKGLKVAGPGPASNWIKGTGAVGVASDLSRYYNDLKTGVYDAVTVFYTGAVPNKIYEVAPYVTEVNFANTYGGGITFNKDRWNRLPKEVQDAFKVGVDAFQKVFLDDLKKQTAMFKQIAEKNGAKISALPQADRVKWAQAIPNAAKGWAKSLDDKGLPGTAVLKGYMEKMRKCGAKPLRNWDSE